MEHGGHLREQNENCMPILNAALSRCNKFGTDIQQNTDTTDQTAGTTKSMEKLQISRLISKMQQMRSAVATAGLSKEIFPYRYGTGTLVLHYNT